MRILIITDNFLPSLGGIERHTYTLACYLSRLSHNVKILTSHSQNFKADFYFDLNLKKLYNIEVIRLLPRRGLIPFISSANYILDGLDIVNYISKNSKKYDIIHYHGNRQLFFMKLDAPLISTLHGIFPACILQSSKLCEKRFIIRCTVCYMNADLKYNFVSPLIMPYCYIYYKFMEKSLKYVNKIICVSEYVKKQIEKFLQLNNLVTIYNFIDFENEIKPALQSLKDFDARDYLKVPDNALLITYFGSLVYNKGVDLLLRAFREIHKKHDNVYLVIGGDGPYKLQLENLAKQIGNIIFTGFIPRKIQLNIMNQSDFFVHPARYSDACPTAILEAMALGLPIVATKLGGVPELVVNGEGGYLCSPNYSDLLEKIDFMISDESLRLRCKTFNLKKSKNFDIATLGHKIIDIYKEFILK